MRPRRGQGALASNPVLVGATTVLVTIVAVFLAYNANDGLPFVPTTTLVVQVEDGGTIGRDSDVREGGFRIGTVDGLAPRQLRDGRVVAEVHLRLDKVVGEIPADSRFAVRAKGAIGGKYLDLQRGTSRQVLPDGAVVPPERTTLTTDLDQALSAFDAPTRAGVRRGLRGSGDGLASRGPDLNRTLAVLPETLGFLRPVMANLASPSTRLRRFVAASARLAGALAPVAADQVAWLRGMADTFGALARDPEALDQVIARAPATLADGERALRVARPVLHDTAALMDDVEASARTAQVALPPLTSALRRTIGPLRDTPRLARDLRASLAALRRLSADPATGSTLRAAAATVATLQPQLRFFGPHQTVCNVVTFWGTMVADIFTGRDSTGPALRGIAQTAGRADDALADMGANELVTGRGVVEGDPQYLHADVFSSAVHEDGTADCEIGQAGFVESWNPHDDTPDRFYRRAVIDPPGVPAYGEGPLYRRLQRDGTGTGELGPARVPAGTTFTRDPGGRAAPETP